MNSLLRITRNIRGVAGGYRGFSSGATSELVKVDVNEKTGVALVTLNRAPVNGLNLELLTSIKNVIGNLEDNKCRGMILTSVSRHNLMYDLLYSKKKLSSHPTVYSVLV